MPTVEEIQALYRTTVPRPVVKIAQEMGVEVYETDKLASNQSGLIRKEAGDNGQSKFVIYVNANHPYTRKRFTVAHELGHFALHQSELEVNEMVDFIKQPIGDGDAVTTVTGPELHRVEGEPLTPQEKQREIEANEFAADLLMPEDQFRNAWAVANSISEIAHKFEVSEGAAAVRAKVLLGETIV